MMDFLCPCACAVCSEGQDGLLLKSVCSGEQLQEICGNSEKSAPYGRRKPGGQQKKPCTGVD